MRIASLVPSGTDIVAWLGLGEHLVGVSHECDHPAATGRPVLTRSRVPSASETAPGAARHVRGRVSLGDALASLT